MYFTIISWENEQTLLSRIIIIMQTCRKTSTNPPPPELIFDSEKGELLERDVTRGGAHSKN